MLAVRVNDEAFGWPITGCGGWRGAAGRRELADLARSTCSRSAIAFVVGGIVAWTRARRRRAAAVGGGLA
jgi:hypothetical protein